jgi:hypothetical protein
MNAVQFESLLHRQLYCHPDQDGVIRNFMFHDDKQCFICKRLEQPRGVNDFK